MNPERYSKHRLLTHDIARYRTQLYMEIDHLKWMKQAKEELSRRNVASTEEPKDKELHKKCFDSPKEKDEEM